MSSFCDFARDNLWAAIVTLILWQVIIALGILNFSEYRYSRLAQDAYDRGFERGLKHEQSR